MRRSPRTKPRQRREKRKRKISPRMRMRRTRKVKTRKNIRKKQVRYSHHTELYSTQPQLEHPNKKIGLNS